MAQESPAVPANTNGTLSASSLTSLLSAIRNASELHTGYGYSLSGNHGVVFNQQLSFFEITKGRFGSKWGLGHSTLFGAAGEPDIDSFGVSVSIDILTTPKAIASVLNSVKPITPNFSELFAFAYVGEPTDDIFNFQFDFAHRTILAGGIGVKF